MTEVTQHPGMNSLRRNQDPALLFLGCSAFASVFPPFPDQQLFEPTLWISGEDKEAE